MITLEIDREEIKKAFKDVSRDVLAEKIGSSRNTIDQIANGLLIVSARRAKEIEMATCGTISAKLLRPDIFT